MGEAEEAAAVWRERMVECSQELYDAQSEAEQVRIGWSAINRMLIEDVCAAMCSGVCSPQSWRLVCSAS